MSRNVIGFVPEMNFREIVYVSKYVTKLRYKHMIHCRQKLPGTLVSGSVRCQ